MLRTYKNKFQSIVIVLQQKQKIGIFDLDYIVNGRQNQIFFIINTIIIGSNNQQIAMMEKASTIIKRSMKTDKINFFESPHIQHFNFNIFHDARYRDLDDLQVCDERLFANQLSPSQKIAANLEPTLPNFLTSPPRNIQNASFGQSPQKSERINKDEPFDSHQGINEKIEYSEQQSLSVLLTPQKKPHKEASNNTNTTVRKQLNQKILQTPESKHYETGLKKLAYQAFSFVSRQKKTTYKDVANSLIDELNDMGIHKGGQMNIKRRVYDALNVLLALGLLKRNGNKIIGKKIENDQIFMQKKLNKRKENKTEQSLSNQLQLLQKEYKEKFQIFQQKEKIAKLIKEKVNKINLLTQRNRLIHQSSKNVQQTTNIDEKLKIKFPFLGLCLRQDTGEKIVRMNPQDSSQLLILKKNNKSLDCSFNSSEKINLIGDIDLVNNLPASYFSLTNPSMQQKKCKNKKYRDGY